ncbi:uncharacterized protein JN550_013913 [Neoarthrinium moseri]|uniref:uncharacterized protein n=1 Tax=Neoarthrinium moseri TaxID=1658444 RepID=UPI001FDB14E9|nr:uncharacterized protein JN550_013913 [Neoarthrinium moseri]KAI1856078.1 hypothetical protein JN550_013913 [Neoarthrinium moseri]
MKWRSLLLILLLYSNCDADSSSSQVRLPIYSRRAFMNHTASSKEQWSVTSRLTTDLEDYTQSTDVSFPGTTDNPTSSTVSTTFVHSYTGNSHTFAQDSVTTKYTTTARTVDHGSYLNQLSRSRTSESTSALSESTEYSGTVDATLWMVDTTDFGRVPSTLTHVTGTDDHSNYFVTYDQSVALYHPSRSGQGVSPSQTASTLSRSIKTTGQPGSGESQATVSSFAITSTPLSTDNGWLMAADGETADLNPSSASLDTFPSLSMGLPSNTALQSPPMISSSYHGVVWTSRTIISTVAGLNLPSNTVLESDLAAVIHVIEPATMTSPTLIATSTSEKSNKTTGDQTQASSVLFELETLASPTPETITEIASARSSSFNGSGDLTHLSKTTRSAGSTNNESNTSTHRTNAAPSSDSVTSTASIVDAFSNSLSPDTQTAVDQGRTAGIAAATVAAVGACGGLTGFIALRYKRRRQRWSIESSSPSWVGVPPVNEPSTSTRALISQGFITRSYGVSSNTRDSMGQEGGIRPLNPARLISGPVTTENSLGWS